MRQLGLYTPSLRELSKYPIERKTSSARTFLRVPSPKYPYRKQSGGKKVNRDRFGVIFWSTKSRYASGIYLRPLSAWNANCFSFLCTVAAENKDCLTEISLYRIMAGFKGYPQIFKVIVGVFNGVLEKHKCEADLIERERNLLE